MNRFSRRLGVLLPVTCALLFPLAISGDPQTADAISGFFPFHVEAERQLEAKFRGIPDATHAENNLRRLTSEPHMSGTDASRRTAEWLRDQYRSFGFDAQIVTYTAWMPQPREVKLEMTKPTRERLASPETSFDEDASTSDARAVVGFNAYSPSGEMTAPVVYVNYGTVEDYQQLASLGVDVKGKVAIARYGQGYRGIKAKLAEEHGAAALILYSDPADDGRTVGNTYPYGPWRPMSGIQRGSIMYTQQYPGDPLTPGVASTPGAKRLAPADATNLPRIPTMPINAQDAAVILENVGGKNAPRDWQGGLPLTYHIGPGEAQVHMKLVMDYQERPLYDVIATLHGTSDDEWVMLGNHHDAWVFGAADPGSGTTAMLEAGRALGELVRSGWKPHRTIVICQWDGEEFGLLGSTEWVEANRAELQSKALIYVNTDVGVSGPNFSASALPSLKDVVRDVTRDVNDPNTGLRVYDAWLRYAATADGEEHGTARQKVAADSSGKAPLGALGAGSDFCPFLDYAGIPAIDLSFTGDYGVYHSIYDDFYWMKHFGDPTFNYQVALAQVLGMIALRFGEADIPPYNFPAYALELEHSVTDQFVRASAMGRAEEDTMEPALDAAAHLSASAARASQALRTLAAEPVDASESIQIDHALAAVEQAFLAPEGLTGRPWFKHTLYAPGSYTGYSAEVIPGVNEAITRKDFATLRREASALTDALMRASARLDDIARLAQQAELSKPSGH